MIFFWLFFAAAILITLGLAVIPKNRVVMHLAIILGSIVIGYFIFGMIAAWGPHAYCPADYHSINGVVSNNMLVLPTTGWPIQYGCPNDLYLGWPGWIADLAIWILVSYIVVYFLAKTLRGLSGKK